MILSHRIQLKPNRKQTISFIKACGVARYAWNWALEQWKTEYENSGKPNANALKKKWNKEKPSWVYESPKGANQKPFSDLNNAFRRFFNKKAKYPKFKKRGNRDSFYIENDKFKVDGNYVKLPKIGRVKMTEDLRLNGKIMAGVVSREANRWFISISVETDHTPIHGDEIIGVDLGVKDAMVLSDGTKLTGPKPLSKKLKTLKKRQRKHSKKQKGSNNRKKSAIKLARLHRKIKNQRKDFLHKTTSMLVSRAKTLVIEDLNVKGMVKNHHLARAISDIGFGEFRRQLEYKSNMNEVDLVIADRFFPSTKLCRKCGSLLDVPLSQRVFKCDCGHEEDRDINAARNLRTLGLRETHACGQISTGTKEYETKLDESGTNPLELYSSIN